MDNPTVYALLTSWDWRPEVIFVLGAAAIFYLNGWLKLRRRGNARLASGWRLASYFGGLFVLAISLMSFVDILGGLLFLMHMIQHLLMLSLAPILLLLGEPFPMLTWGMPGGKQLAERLFDRQGIGRQLLQKLPVGGVLLLSVGFLWGWHDPNAYNAALRIGWLHDLQHLTFFLPGMLFWWKVTGAAPRMHGRSPLFPRLALLLLMAVANMIPAVGISLASEPIYTYYLDMPRVAGIDVMTDQVIGGVIMWVPGTMMYMVALLILLFRAFQQSEKAKGGVDNRRYMVEAAAVNR
jgi:putative membrane protein